MEVGEQDFYRLVANARNPDRLFAVRSNKYCSFYAGHVPGDLQVLIGRSGPEKILVLFFSRWGDLYEIQRSALPCFQRPPEEQYLAVNDAEFHKYLLDKFGFTPGLVHVHQFSVADDDCGFWVGPLPWHYNQILAAPQEYSPETQAENQEMIRQFLLREVCVLSWGDEWWVLEANGVEAGWDLPENSS